MFKIVDGKAVAVQETTFSSLDMTEREIEEIIKENTSLITEEESMLIVGQQVRNSSNAISDLIGINQNGDLVLIEIKRDRSDITSRRESFEFQAIRYAASFATIKNVDELISKIYVPFLERNQAKVMEGLTITEFANRNVRGFFHSNGLHEDDFNERQQIILVASDFDEQTKSAVAWLNRNGVDIHCFQLTPYKINGELFIKSDRILPLENYDDFYVDVTGNARSSANNSRRRRVRRILPRIDQMIEWGVVQPGDVLQARNFEDQARLLDSGLVMVDGEEKSLQVWLKELTGWSSVATYAMTIHLETGRTLAEIRREYMKENEVSKSDF